MSKITKQDLQAALRIAAGRLSEQERLVEALSKRIAELVAMPPEPLARAEAAIARANVERDGAVRGAIAGKLAYDEIFAKCERLKAELAAVKPT